MALTKREAQYDKHIAPLMTKIIKLCNKHDIPMIASFQLNDDRKGDTDCHEDTGEELGPFYCTTVMTEGKHVGAKLIKAGSAMAPDPPPTWRAEVHHADGRVDVVAGSHMEDKV